MNLHQAYLWIGPETDLLERTVRFLQSIFCAAGGCRKCVTCRALAERRHHALTWLTPENSYTVKQLEGLFKAVCFALDPGERHLIVIERADLLNSACANSLLKSLEEPPVGYHYILLAPRTEGILSTLSSRCIVETFSAQSPIEHRLLPYFTEFQASHASELLKEIEKERIPEREIDQLLDACMYYWHGEYKKALGADDQQKSIRARRALATCEAAREKPPMPGSSKLFLKNLFLRLTLALQ